MVADNASSWVWHDTRKQFYYSQFIKNLPDLNFRNEKVHEEMKTILNYWLELGIDGIRVDALRHVYESESLKDEPKIKNDGAVSFLNLNHIYTIDQDEVYDLIKEWRSLINEFKQKDHRTRFEKLFNCYNMVLTFFIAVYVQDLCFYEIKYYKLN